MGAIMEGGTYRFFHVKPGYEELRADAFVTTRLKGYSRTHIQKLMRRGSGFRTTNIRMPEHSV